IFLVVLCDKILQITPAITMRTILLLVGLAGILSASAQSSAPTKEEVYKVYANLVGGKWETKGQWASGAAFHQEITVEWELTKNIFIVKTHDYVDSKQFDQAMRNYGIRAWDNATQTMQFWEFDVFGGVVTGTVQVQSNHLYHIYQYPDKKGGTMTLADVWEYVDKDTYNFKVCTYENGKPGKVFMNSTYHRKQL
ncbi:MAG: hypothetical protein ACK4TA_04045, partial [Saprospiraceae bacterium]